jgi:hypothetical protein
VTAGQEYNHGLLAVETGQHDGPLPPVASLGEVAVPGRARPAALLSALKPRGNPLAGGRAGRPAPETGVTIRLRDAGALPAETVPAEVSLLDGITSARLTDVTETADGQPLEVVAGRAVVPVPPAGLVTLAAVLAPAPAPEPVISRIRDPQTGTDRAPEGAFPVISGAEPVQPVFTRYWLHGKGAAPAGNLPVAVHVSPGRVALEPAPEGGAGEGASLRVTVAGGPVPVTGEVTLEVPRRLSVTGPDGAECGPLRYELAGRGFAAWDLSVRALPGAGPGRYFVAARTGDDLGQVLEDAALVTIGEPPGPVPGQPRAELLAAQEADRQARGAEISVDLAPAALEVAPGGHATLAVTLANRTASVIRGECQLLSPFGTWPAAEPWARAFTAAPGETVVLDYPVTLPPGTRPGSHWWALAKVMYFGRLQYSDCAEIRVTSLPS